MLIQNLPLFSFPTIPQAVLMYWVTHNTFSVLQTLVLRLPAFKKFANIPDPPVRPPASKTPGKGGDDQPTGFFKAIRDTTDAFSETYEQAKERANRKMLEKEQAEQAKKRAQALADRKAEALKRYQPSAQAQAQGPSLTDTMAAAGSDTQRPTPKVPSAVDPNVLQRRSRVQQARKKRESSRQSKHR